jgi:hypothetical protein
MALISNAQVTTLLNEYYPNPNILKIQEKDNIPQYVKDLQEYQKECWNDSVQVVVWKSWEGMGFVESIWPKGERPYNCESYPTDSILYIHNEPTFMGFIFFLNKKYK